MNELLKGYLTWLLVYWLCLSLFLLYRVHKNKVKISKQPYVDFLYVLDNIRSCYTFAELETASQWLSRLEYSMEPGAREILETELNKKMQHLENELNIQTGGTPRKVQ